MDRAAIEALSFEGLSFGYASDARILEDVDLDLPMGRIVRVDGDGKSTLLKILCGLLEPSRGTYRINGRAVSEMSFAELLPLRLAMGYGFDFGGLLANKTLEENVRLPLDYHGICDAPEAEARVDDWFARFDLDAARGARPAAVSARRRKAACLVRALIHRPQLLLLDEPVVGLPRAGVTALLDALLEARQVHGLEHVFIATGDERLLDAGLFEAQLVIEGGRVRLVEGETRRAS